MKPILELIIFNVLNLLANFVGELLQLHETLSGSRSSSLVSFLIELQEVLFGAFNEIGEFSVAFFKGAHAYVFRCMNDSKCNEAGL